MELVAVIREVVDAASLVHSTLGPGFLEGIYGRALLLELRSRGFGIEREKQIRIWYGSHIVGKHCLDLIVEGTVIVELKASQGLVPVNAAQLRSYLHATNCPVGVLFNFGAPALQWEVLHREIVAEKTD